MSKGFLDYLKDEQNKKVEKKVKKAEDFLNISVIPEPMKIPKNAGEIFTQKFNHIPWRVENKKNDPLEHAMMIYEGLKDKPKKGITVISDDINDPIAHAAMLI